MSKVLLINSNRFKQPWPVIPFGLTCVAASLEKAGYGVEVLDLCFSKDTAKDIKDTVNKVKPDVIGISIRNIDNGTPYNAIFFLDQVKDEVITPCKTAFKGPIVIGGPAVGISGREMLAFFDLEYAIAGDGELAMVEFVKRIEEKLFLHGLKGLVIRSKEEGKIIQELPPYYVEDLNSIPYPKLHKYIDIKKYHNFDSPLQIQTKRGCALKCVYCTYNRIEGHTYRFRDPKLIADEIETLVKETGINHIEFTDSAFNIPLNHAKEVLRELIKKKLNLRLRTLGLNPGAVDEELVSLMKEAGFTDVDLGAESGCNITLKSLGKNYTKADVIKAGELLHKKNIAITWYLLLGAPGETEETLKETFDTITKTASSWDLINIGIGLRVYKGSPIAEKMLHHLKMAQLITSERGAIDISTKRNHTHDKLHIEDNFLHPVAFETGTLKLNTIKRLTKEESLKHPNIFMYDEDETTPLFLLMLGTKMLRMLGSREPIWKLFILLRKLQGLTGIRRLKSIKLSMKK